MKLVVLNVNYLEPLIERVPVNSALAFPDQPSPDPCWQQENPKQQKLGAAWILGSELVGAGSESACVYRCESLLGL